MHVDICCIGHITIDKVVTPEDTVYMPGGTSFYFSNAIANLASSYLLITAVAGPEQYAVTALEEKGIAIKLFPTSHTLFFENRYGENTDERVQRVLQQADPFQPHYFSGIEAQIFHLGPLLANDIPVEGITALSQKAKLSLDVQGFLRKVEGKKVVPVDWDEKHVILPHIFFLKANEEEMEVITGRGDINQGAKFLADWGVKEVIITRGSKGSVVYDGNRFYTIPAFIPQQVRDATGCGDTYMAGYLYKRSKGAGIQEAGEFAAAMATLKLEVSGPFTGTKEKVAEVLQSKKRELKAF